MKLHSAGEASEPRTTVPAPRIEGSAVSQFVEPSERERLAAVRHLSDASLVGHYWRLEDLDGLTDDERQRLRNYRHETFGFDDYCECLVAHSDRGADEVADLTAVLDRWEAAFRGLRLWHQERSILDCERNPLAKVLIYEESRITGARSRLEPREASADQRPGVPASRVAPPRVAPARSTPGRARGKSKIEDRMDDADLAKAVLVLAEAVDRLSDVISTRPEAPRP